MHEQDDRDSTDISQDEKGELREKITKLTCELSELRSLVTSLIANTTKEPATSCINPDGFMMYGEFCESMQVTQRESVLLLKSLRGDPGFLEVSERCRRLYVKTGIEHLFKIKDEVRSRIEKQTKKAGKK